MSHRSNPAWTPAMIALAATAGAGVAGFGFGTYAVYRRQKAVNEALAAFGFNPRIAALMANKLKAMRKPQLFTGKMMNMTVTAKAPPEPPPEYVLALVKSAAKTTGGSEDTAKRTQWVQESTTAMQTGDVASMWSRLWRLTRMGLFANASPGGSKRMAQVNDIVVNLMAYELLWRRSTDKSFADTNEDRITNLFHRYQYIVSRISPETEVWKKYGKRLQKLQKTSGCKLIKNRGPTWGKYLTSKGAILPMGVPGVPSTYGDPANYTVEGCDTNEFMLKLTGELSYTIGRLAVLSINASQYVVYGFGDLMAGITLVGEAFTL